MFTLEADFSNMVDCGDLRVNSIVHKARIDVNEKGIDDATGTGNQSKFFLFESPIFYSF